jgi:hypothetical protein
MSYFLIGAAIAVGLVLLVIVVDGLSLGVDGRQQSMGWNRRNGKYRVLYPDGNVSQAMTLEVAQDYAAMFDGRVIAKKAGVR